MQPIPVVCDRCRAEGESGADPFAAFGALLDFEPVPRHSRRADGWDTECQRAFIAALSLTGSVRAACRAVGKSAFGVEQLLRHEGSEGFTAAYDEAMAISADERSRRLAEGLRAVAAEQSGRRPPDPPWAKRKPGRPPVAVRSGSARDEEEDTPEARRALLDVLLKRYCAKLQSERTCRLDGRIVEADFYVRQLTFIEVALDLATQGGLFEALASLRFGSTNLLEICETPATRLLDRARRLVWQENEELDRPVPPPEDRFESRAGIFVERPGAADGSAGLEPGTPDAERRRILAEQLAAAAREQAEWEAAARRAYERRRDSDAAS
ncbi:MAG TPA: hypothetical protein VF603_12805 [Allosphingosinicella sp.]|jgi:hypothetical protein